MVSRFQLAGLISKVAIVRFMEEGIITPDVDPLDFDSTVKRVVLDDIKSSEITDWEMEDCEAHKFVTRYVEDWVNSYNKGVE